MNRNRWSPPAHAIAASVLLVAMHTQSRAAPPTEQAPVSPGMKELVRTKPVFPTGVQPGQSYLWTRPNGVPFGPNDPATFAKQLMLPAGSWQITIQFQALLTDGFNTTTNRVSNASLRCQIFGAGAATSEALVATPALFNHPTTAGYQYQIQSVQTLNLQYLYTSDGQASGSIALMCTPSVRNNSIVMNNLTISAIPIPAVFREQG